MKLIARIDREERRRPASRRHRPRAARTSRGTSTRSRPRMTSDEPQHAGDGSRISDAKIENGSARGKREQRVVRRALEPRLRFVGRPRDRHQARAFIARSAAERTSSGLNVVRHRKSPGSQTADRTAGTAAPPPPPTRSECAGRATAPTGPIRRSIYSHDRRRRRRRDVQRPGVPADEQPAARDQRPQFRQVELAEIDNPVRRGAAAPAAPPPRSRSAASRSDGPELSTIRRSAMPARARRPAQRRPAPASAGTDCRR